MTDPITLANCSIQQLEQVRDRGLHSVRSRKELLFAAGALNNQNLRAGLGSMELATFYDGMVAAGHLEQNPYWPKRK